MVVADWGARAVGGGPGGSAAGNGLSKALRPVEKSYAAQRQAGGLTALQRDRSPSVELSQNDLRLSSARLLRDNSRGLFFASVDCSLHRSTKSFVHLLLDRAQ
jgi:hypothetical protein